MKWDKKTTGIPDEYFIRGDIPMTKSEIRTISLSKLQIEHNSRVLDIGCGTGSVSVECGLLCKEGFVIAIDQEVEAIQLTQKNLAAFGVTNAKVILGKAPDSLPEQMFDRIFLGGGSKAVEPVVAYASKHLVESGIFVANTILLDSTYQLLKALEKWGFEDIGCVQVNIARGQQKPGWMMMAQNPIYILSAKKSTKKT
ncbi:MAG: precorrin-6Y C5,15-methyltransferase (decarboxylating) subunit CbiT [Vallitaleaceae bacterium]|nr:precorrin-6Y C5,15-methyltransferase (decarboxylating) subunit CbiT [Vallitaleaceae bacterium]